MNDKKPEAQVREIFWTLYRETFANLYLYCARRATTKPVIAFIMKSLYEYALDEIRHGQEILLIDLYKWAYEFFAVQSQPKSGGQVKHIQDFRDVYDIKTNSGSRAIRREQILEHFYRHLEFKEREVLWLSFFEELSSADRAYVMGLGEEPCTTFFYESLKKARSAVTSATPDQSRLSRISAYFGSVASLLKKAKLHEELDVDQEIRTSLQGIFMDQFAKQPIPPSPFSNPSSSSSNQPPMSPSESAPASARTQVRPLSSVTSVSSSAVESSDEIDTEEWLDDDSSFTSQLWRRAQGFLVLVMVGALGSFAYFNFFSFNARADKLIKDSRVAFSADFTSDDKQTFGRDALLFLAKDRDFTNVTVQKQGKMVAVRFAIKDFGTESFLLYPQQQAFDFLYKWQPKEYKKVRSLS